MGKTYHSKPESSLTRRKLFKTTLALAGGSMMASVVNAGQQDTKNITANTLKGRRKLGGTLEVSSIGLGVQNMTRTYQTTIPTRTEMIKIIRAAFDNGVTLFDAAEAYGPLKVETLLGEALVPFRNKVVIETKFGWNIDQQTGQRLPGLNSKPDHI